MLNEAKKSALKVSNRLAFSSAETVEKTAWNFYLHGRHYDLSWDAFRRDFQDVIRSTEQTILEQEQD